MKSHVVASTEPILSPQAWMFRWRKEQRWARRNPEAAAVLVAERLVGGAPS